MRAQLFVLFGRTGRQRICLKLLECNHSQYIYIRTFKAEIRI